MNVCVWVILKAACEALVSKMNIDNFWSHIFIIAIMTENWNTVLSYLIVKIFGVHLVIFADSYMKKNPLKVFKATPIFSAW